MPRPLILAITGASGAVYAVRLVDALLRAGRDVHLSVSDSGRAVLKQELDIEVDLESFEPRQLFTPRSTESVGGRLLRAVMPAPHDSLDAVEAGRAPRLSYHHYRDMLAPMASGSFVTGGMVICPCSGATLSAIAHAASTNLIQRAAEVQLKERRPLVLVPRETPLSAIQLENMRRAAEAGAVVLPAMPGWYHGVESLGDLVDFVVARICDQLGIENDLIRRWGGEGAVHMYQPIDE